MIWLAAVAVVAAAGEGPTLDHAKVAHMYIARKGYEMFIAQYPDSEMAQYIGNYNGDEPASDQDGFVVEGAYDEDIPHENPWNQLISQARHFWDWTGGYYKGLPGFDSAYNRAFKYFTGGYGAEGKYDAEWSRNSGKKKGAQGQGVIYLYRHGQKAKAYWYLGHALHLLEDMTVPAHTHLWPHVLPDIDRYETYLKSQHSRWAEVSSKPVELFGSLYELFQNTAEITQQFDAGSGPGDDKGRDGKADQGARRADGFTDDELDEEANLLMPLAFKRVAAMYRYFYSQIDRKAPKVKLQYPSSEDLLAPDLAREANITLRALATDDISGAGKNSFQFEYRVFKEKNWSEWQPVSPLSGPGEISFQVQPGILYAIRATAQDAAGNTGFSSIKYLTIPGQI